MAIFEIDVDVDARTGMRSDVYAIERTSLHLHPRVVEIVYVLRGTLHVKVSCEEFDLGVGDFAVINRSDPHLLAGPADNVTAVLHLDPDAFTAIDPLVNRIVFACESYDLARYRRQETLLRGLLLDLIDPAGRPRAEAAACELVRLLCDGYSLENYYHRTTEPSRAQRQKFRTVVGHMWRHAARRDALDMIAAAEHYSKSYVSHLVKDIGAVSFADLLSYFRVAEAEKLLLTGDATMLEIAAACGFSDVKYFTRAFVNWFHESPADYRKRFRPDVVRDDVVAEVSPELTVDLVAEHRRHVAAAAEAPRLSMTPLLLKNLASRRNLFSANDADSIGDAGDRGHDTGMRTPHLLPIRIDASDVETGYLLDGLPSFDRIGARPCLVVEYTTRAATLALVTAIAERLTGTPEPHPSMWLTYATTHDRDGVDYIATRATELGFQLQPILTP